MVMDQPSPLSLPCAIFWSPYAHSINGDMPAVGPYCKPESSSSWLRCTGSSTVGSTGSRNVKFRDVIGNVDECGLPARREITPGSCSRGRRERTGIYCQAIRQKRERETYCLREPCLVPLSRDGRGNIHREAPSMRRRSPEPAHHCLWQTPLRWECRLNGLQKVAS